MLARLEDAEIGKIVRRVNAFADAGDRERLPAVLASVSRARKQGFFAASGPIRPDLASLAINLPFDDPFGNPLVVSIWGEATAIDKAVESLVASMSAVIEAASPPSFPS